MIIHKKDILSLFFLVFLGFLFFFDVLFLGNVFYAGDNLSINVPGKILFLKMVKQGQFPLWNPYIFSGTPMLADINLGLLSPLNIFYFFFQPLRALTLTIVIGVIGAGLSMYFYSRIMKMTRIAALVASTIFMFSGSIMTHIMNTAILNTVIWIPLLFLFIELLVEKKHLKYALLSAIVLAFSLYGGHIQYFYYIALFSLFYILFKPIPLKEKVTYAGFIYIPAFFLSAIQLLPFLEYAQYSTRPTQQLSYAGAVSLVSYIRHILPNFFGIMKDGTSWGATADINGYVGIIPLFFTVFVIIKKKTASVKFFATAALICLLLSLGKYSPLYLLAFYVLPFFARFRSPTSILVIYTFCLSLLAGYGLDYFMGTIQKKNKASHFFSLAMFATFLVSVIAIYLKFSSFAGFVGFMKWLNSIKQTAFLNRFLEYSTERMHIIFNLWMNNIAIASLFLFLFLVFVYVFKRQGCVYPIQRFLIVLLIATELMYFAGNTYIVSKENILTTPSGILNFFKKDKTRYRILTMIDPGAKPPFGDPSYFPAEAIKAMDFFQANTNIFHDIEIVSGYASIVPKDYEKYISPKPSQDPTGITQPIPDMKQLDELGVKYIITAGRYGKELSETKQYKPAFMYFDPRIHRLFVIYENLASDPRTFVVDNNSRKVGTAKIISYTPNQIRIRAQSPTRGRLILTDNYYPGWEVEVNNKKQEIAKYKIFRSVAVEKGTSEITFTYKPKSFTIGAIINAVNWIYILGFLGFVFVKEHKDIGHKFHVGKSDIKKDA